MREFVNNVHTLMNNYTVQVLQDRINKDYSVIDYGSFDDREIQTAIKNYSQQKLKIMTSHIPKSKLNMINQSRITVSI